MKRLFIIDIKDRATDLTLSLPQLRIVKNRMTTPRKRNLYLETNRIDLFNHLILTNKTTRKLTFKPRNQRKMLSQQPCKITDKKITIMMMLVGLESHSMI